MDINDAVGTVVVLIKITNRRIYTGIKHFVGKLDNDKDCAHSTYFHPLNEVTFVEWPDLRTKKSMLLYGLLGSGYRMVQYVYTLEGQKINKKT